MEKSISQPPFAKRVKDELSHNSYTMEEKKYILSGFARNGGLFSFGKLPALELHTQLASTAKLLYSALQEVYSLAPTIQYERKTRFGRGLTYIVKVQDKRLFDVMQDLEILEDGIFRIPPKEGVRRKNLRFLVIGCFLANGSVNNPSSQKTSYFAEMAFTDKQDALLIRKKLDSFKGERTMSFKYIKRREQHVLYLKKSDQISVFLAYLGATEEMFEFENARIIKEDTNITNRLSICDAANYSKSISTAKKDIEAIDTVLKEKPLDSFDKKTQAVLKARKEKAELNYRELADYVSQQEEIPITKSGIVHILAKIRSQAEEINEEEKKKKKEQEE